MDPESFEQVRRMMVETSVGCRHLSSSSASSSSGQPPAAQPTEGSRAAEPEVAGAQHTPGKKAKGKTPEQKAEDARKKKEEFEAKSPRAQKRVTTTEDLRVEINKTKALCKEVGSALQEVPVMAEGLRAKEYPEALIDFLKDKSATMKKSVDTLLAEFYTPVKTWFQKVDESTDPDAIQAQ
eukprot:7958136-Pyramimonas_sp.AAC.1